MKNQIEIYTSPDGSAQIEVQFEGDTFWLSLNQIADLFEKDKSVISRHLKNIFKSSELVREAVVAKNATTASDGKTYEVDYYNLDAILSVGYRVNSKRGTQFRQWATQRLKDYLVQGFAINEERLRKKNKEVQVLYDGIRIISRAIEEKAKDSADQEWVNQFAVGLQLLGDYDHEALDTKGNHTRDAEYPTLDEYEKMIFQMRLDSTSEIFGKEKDGGFISAINQIRQAIGESDIYPT